MGLLGRCSQSIRSFIRDGRILSWNTGIRSWPAEDGAGGRRSPAGTSRREAETRLYSIKKGRGTHTSVLCRSRLRAAWDRVGDPAAMRSSDRRGGIYAGVHSRNAGGRKLYERFGYSVVKRSKLALPNGEGLPVVEMAKGLLERNLRHRDRRACPNRRRQRPGGFSMAGLSWDKHWLPAIPNRDSGRATYPR